MAWKDRTSRLETKMTTRVTTRSRRETPHRPVVIADFTLSWDGRLLGKTLPAETIDAFRQRLATHRVRRISVAPAPDLFRKLAAAGLIDELRVTWRPCFTGGKTHPPITGFDPAFLPRGIVLDRVKLQRKPDGYFAHYRVRRTRG